MIKVVKSAIQIPLIDIGQMEEDGVDAFERFKVDMAIRMVRELPEGLFNKLFKTTIIDPRNEKQHKRLLMECGENPNSYNKAMLNKFRELKNKEAAEIQVILEIEV